MIVLSSFTGIGFTGINWASLRRPLNEQGLRITPPLPAVHEWHHSGDLHASQLRTFDLVNGGVAQDLWTQFSERIAQLNAQKQGEFLP